MVQRKRFVSKDLESESSGLLTCKYSSIKKNHGEASRAHNLWARTT